MDSVAIILNKYEKKLASDKFENQVFFYIKAYYYSKVNRQKEAIVLYKKSLEFIENNKRSDNTRNLALYNIANDYFTLEDFENANIYALKLKPLIKEFQYYEYVGLYSIMGFYQAKKFNYNNALNYYKIAKKRVLKEKDDCKQVEVDYKVAELYSLMKKNNEALELINKTIAKAIECNIPDVEKNCRKVKIKILKDANQLKDALSENDSIELLKVKIDKNNRELNADKVEAKYKAKFKEKENGYLKKINQQNENTLTRQKHVIFLSLLGLLILSVFIFIIFKLNKRQKKINNELETQAKIIENNNSELKRLNLLNQKIFSVISHDFKAPISTLKHLLMNDNSENPYVKEIGNQLNQSENMLNSLLDWAKSEMQNNIEKNEINLPELINDTIKSLKTSIDKKNLFINNKIDCKTNVYFNKYALKIIIRNIVSNSIKYSSENKKIDIFFENNAIKIRDYGTGIDSKKLETLLTKQVYSNIGTNKETGFGIGLYLCNELIRKNNGALDFKNLDVGCEFTIHLNTENSYLK